MSNKEASAIVVLASSRSQGNTRLLVDYLVAGTALPVVDLSSKKISPYDYDHANAGDDFIPLIETLCQKDVWVFATPVYWYTMSAPMKIFFDRLSDLLTTHQELGRKLRGRSMAVIASGTDPSLPDCFEAPFRLTCDYLGMYYRGACYGCFERDLTPAVSARGAVEAFGAKLLGDAADS
jgi:multimeric flavodoxin WrbA